MIYKDNKIEIALKTHQLIGYNSFSLGIYTILQRRNFAKTYVIASLDALFLTLVRHGLTTRQLLLSMSIRVVFVLLTAVGLIIKGAYKFENFRLFILT